MRQPPPKIPPSPFRLVLGLGGALLELALSATVPVGLMVFALMTF